MNSELVEKHQFLYHYLNKKIRSLIKYSKESSLNLCCFAGGVGVVLVLHIYVQVPGQRKPPNPPPTLRLRSLASHRSLAPR